MISQGTQLNRPCTRLKRARRGRLAAKGRQWRGEAGNGGRENSLSDGKKVGSRAKVGSRSISRVLSWTAIPLDVLLPARSSSLPGSSASHARASLFGLAPDGVCRASRVTTPAVSSYLAVSPLPARSRFAERGHRRSVLCCTFRHLTVPGR